jgi:hypothetical protein
LDRAGQREDQNEEREQGRGEPQKALEPQETAQLPTVEFTKIEKNLASLGFFTPSSKRIKDTKAKTITFAKTIDGNRVEARATILPAALYGLPVTADQDKYFALQKIITDIQQRQGKVTNPITFTSAELLHLLHKYRDSGKNYKEMEEWLTVMSATTIVSEGVVYLAGRKVWAKDRFHVFDRAVSFGKELEPGKVADKNYVWLSQWQLENINNHWLLSVDLEAYRQLRNHIAKALVPLLQIWLFASREEGSFEKRYDELCQILNIRRYHHRSRVQEQLAPSLNELTQHRYLKSWQVEHTTDRTGYKIILRHGDKFHRDRRRRLSQKEQASSPPKPQPTAAVSPPIQPRTVPAPQRHAADQTIDSALLVELTKRGISATQAQKRLQSLAPAQPVHDQLEYGDYIISQASPGTFRNPPGFYISLIRDNVIPPDSFETTHRRQLREQREQERQQWLFEEQQLRSDYDRYREQQKDRYIKEHLTDEHYQRLFQAKKKHFKRQYPLLPDQTLIDMAHGAIRGEIEPQVTSLTFEEWKKQRSRQQPGQGAGETDEPLLTV